MATATATAQETESSILVSPYMVETEGTRPISAEWINLAAPENRTRTVEVTRSITATRTTTATSDMVGTAELTRTTEIDRSVRIEAGEPADEILVPFVRFRTTARTPQPPVFVIFGEEQTALVSPATAERFLRLAALLLNTSDVVLVGQRGMESGLPYLTCAGDQDLALDEGADREAIDLRQSQYFARCATFWQTDGVDTEGYNIAEIAADVDDLRRALGYETISLVGVDLGVQVGFEIMRDIDESVDRALFALVVGPNQIMKLPSDIQAHLVKLDARVRDDPQLSVQIPDFLALVESVLASLEGQSVTVEVIDPETGEAVQITVNKLDLQYATAMAQGGAEQKALPAHYLAMAGGDFTWLGEQALAWRRNADQTLAPTLTNCASGATEERRARIALESDETLLGNAANGVRFDVCDSVGSPDVGEQRRVQVVSEVPVLMISGSMDGHTPPSNAEAQLAGLINGQHLIVDGATHDLLDEALAEITPIVRDFLVGDPLAPLATTRIEIPYRLEPVTVAPLEITNWRGEYFNNRTLQNDPTLVRDDAEINFNWGEGSPAPAINPDNFSVRWTMSREVPAGTYRFSVWVDDGVRIWVDETLVLDQWHEGTARNYVVDVNVVRGLHTVKMEYFEAEGTALAQLSIGRIDVYPDWKAEYYDNPNLAAPPMVVRNEPAIDHVWGDTPPVPGLVGGAYSVRWTGRYFFAPGAYRFDANVSGGGVRLWVDNTLLIDDWTEISPRTSSGTAAFDAGGIHEVRVEYVYARGNAAIRVAWQRLAGPTLAPTAVIEAPTYAQVSETVPFDGTGSSAADGSPLASYAWDFGDGTTANGPAVNHVYTGAGVFNVTLTVTDANGKSDATTHQIRVDATPVTPPPPAAPVPVIRSPDQGIVGQAITFDARASQSTNPIVSFDWQFGDGTSANAVVVQKIYGAPGVYNVRLTLTDDQGLQGSTNKYVQIFAATPTPMPPATATPVPPAATPAPPVQPTQPVATVPPATVAPATPVAPVQPLPPEQPPSQSESPLPGVTPTPENVITPPTAVIAASVESQPLRPVPNANGILSVQVEAGTSVFFDATPSQLGSAPIASYYWTFGDGSTSALASSAITYQTPGEYTVLLVVSDANQQQTDETWVVTVTED